MHNQCLPSTESGPRGDQGVFTLTNFLRIGSTSYLLAILLSAIRPHISGYIATCYIARYIWLYSLLAIKPLISGYICN